MGIDIFLSTCQNAGIETLTAAQSELRYQSNSIGHSARLAGTLRPADENEVRTIMLAAHEHKVPVYPISTGHNWGYGSALPHQNDNVILDLSRMNRIISFDQELGIIVLEPGVTTGQLYDYLKQNGDGYMLPATGAGPTNSLIGNALERGFGLVPTADHFSGVMSLRAILADGTLYQSALAELNNTDVNNLYKWGVGPYIDGLFAQGNIGVVTQMAIALAPKPEHATILLLGTDDVSPANAVAYIQKISRLYAGNLSAIQMTSRARFLASGGSESGHKGYEWNCLVFIYGDKQIAKHISRKLFAQAKGIFSKRRLVSVRLLQRLAGLIACCPAVIRCLKLAKEIETGHELAELALGYPTQMVLRNFVYRSNGAEPPAGLINIDADKRGLLWYAPLVPLRPISFENFLSTMKPIMAEYNFPLSVSFTTLNNSCVDATIALQFNRENAAELQRATACYRALFMAGQKNGFIPYRVGLQGMGMLVNEQHTFWQVSAQIKAALDPHNIIAPGRYNL